MKYAINLFTVVIFTWPSLVLGYIYSAIETGFIAGKICFEKHSDMAVEKFSKREVK